MALSTSDRRFIEKQKDKHLAKPKPFIDAPSEGDLLRTAFEFLHRITKITREEFAAAYKKGGMDLISQMYDDAACDSVPTPEE